MEVHRIQNTGLSQTKLAPQMLIVLYRIIPGKVYVIRQSASTRERSLQIARLLPLASGLEVGTRWSLSVEHRCSQEL